ncbi:MAG: M1 family metallopeptidase [Pyrinomonadaceae bacterium]
MILRFLILILLIQSGTIIGQTRAAKYSIIPVGSNLQTESVKRAIRREIPLTNSIKKALKAGTRNLSGVPGPNYWQLNTDYVINASLDPTTSTITGSETISLHNNSNDELQEIVLRLDHNIFRPKVPRGFSVPAETTDGMIVTRIRINGSEVDLKAAPPRRGEESGDRRKTYVSGLDQTVATISLASPISAKSTAKIEIDWNTKLPGGDGGRGHRMTQRWDNRLFQPTQWYPRLANYDDLRGWETNVYLGPSEFYNSFGRFDVKIEMPAGWLVSGTGVLQNPEEVLTPTVRGRLTNVLMSDAEITIVGKDERSPGKSTQTGKKLIWHYLADQVNDFAWATSNEFVWTATRATIPEKGPVPIYMFYLPERANRFVNAGKITRHALEFYSHLWIPYDFPQLTLQDGPSAGMEYPMVINSNQGAADHETFHQWIPMMIGTNETRYGWMDEGFNQYSNILSDADYEGRTYSVDGLGQRYGRISGDEDEPPMMWNANYGGPFYGFQTYSKTPLMFSMLGGIVGDDAMNAAIKKYMATWKFKHPSPWDFAFFMNKELNHDLNWFWYYWLFTTESVDGSIKTVQTKNGKTEVVVHQAGQMPSPVVLKVEFAAGPGDIGLMPNAKKLNENTVLVRWPEEVWFDGDRDFNAVLDLGDRKIRKITLDPFGRFPDSDPADNVWTSD